MSQKIRVLVTSVHCSILVSLCSLICRHFDIKKKDDEEGTKLFSVPDFIGDACKAIASRIRGAVAGVQFDDFHKVCSM